MAQAQTIFREPGAWKGPSFHLRMKGWRMVEKARLVLLQLRTPCSFAVRETEAESFRAR